MTGMEFGGNEPSRGRAAASVACAAALIAAASCTTSPRRVDGTAAGAGCAATEVAAIAEARRMGRFHAALAAAEEAVRRCPGPTVRAGLDAARADLGLDAASVAAFDRERSGDERRRGRSAYLDGAAAFRRGQLAAAATSLHEAMQLDPQPEVFAMLARVHDAAGRRVDARRVEARGVALLERRAGGRPGPRLRTAGGSGPGMFGAHWRLAGQARVLARAAPTDTSVGLWDLGSGELMAERPAGDQVRGLDISRDGRVLATVAVDERVRLWRDGRMATPELAGTALALSGDGGALVLAQQGRLALYDTGTWRRRWQVDAERPYRLAFAADGGAIIGQSGDRAMVWDAGTGAVEASLPVAADALRALAIDRGSAQVAIADGASIALFAVGAPGERWRVRLAGGGDDGAAGVARDGLAFAASALWVIDEDGRRSRLALADGAVLGQDPVPPADAGGAFASAAALDPDSGSVVAVEHDVITPERVFVRDYLRDDVHAFSPAPIRAVTGLAFASDGTLAVASGDAGLTLWTPEGNVRFLQHGFAPEVGAPEHLSWLDDRTLLTQGQSRLFVWDTATGRLRRTIEPKMYEPIAVHAPSGRLAGWVYRSGLMVMPIDGQAPPLVLPLEHDASLEFAPDGQHLLAAPHGRGQSLRVWRLADRAELLAREGPFQAAAFESSAAVWASRPEARLERIELPTGATTALVDEPALTIAFDAGGRRAATRHRPHVRLWDVGGRTSRVLPGSPGWGGPLVFSADGALLAITDGDGGVQIWDVAAATLRATLASAARLPPEPQPPPEWFDQRQARAADYRVSGEWLVWSPDGAVAGSLGAAELFGWVAGDRIVSGRLGWSRAHRTRLPERAISGAPARPRR